LSIRKPDVEGQAVTHRIFEDLFSSSLLGSAMYPVVKLEALYKKTGILESEESIVLHAQEYWVKPEKPAPNPKKRGLG
jgi:hypothetical protein